MRITRERARAAILRPEQALRDTALCFCARERIVDDTVMPVVIAAYERYGADAFRRPITWRGLPQTRETFAWLLSNWGNYDRPPENPDAPDYYPFDESAQHALAYAPIPLVQAHYAELMKLPFRRESLRSEIDQRLALHALTDDELEAKLIAIFDRLWIETTKDDLWSEMEFVTNEMLCRPEGFRPRALEVLRQELPYRALPAVFSEKEEAVEWKKLRLQSVMGELAGAFRAAEVVPRLFELLRFGDDNDAMEAAIVSLKNIGNAEVAQSAKALYQTGVDYLKLALHEILGECVLDETVGVAPLLEIAEQESDLEMRCFALSAALQALDTDALEPARQFLLTTPKDPETLTVRQDLLEVSQLLEWPFPEFAEWQADSAHDQEYRQEYYRTHPRLSWMTGESLEGPHWSGAGQGAPIYGTIRNEGEHVGRNDPCPCGSGKKYKKCCMRADQAANV